jgi:hypothetical protein
MRRARAPSLPSKNARPRPADAAPESGPDRQDGQRGWTICKCANSHWQKWLSPAERLFQQGGSGQAARVTRSRGQGVSPAQRPGSVIPGPGIRRPCQQPAGVMSLVGTDAPRLRRWPLLYFAAVLAVRSVRIALLTRGAKRARTADLLHAMGNAAVHLSLDASQKRPVMRNTARTTFRTAVRSRSKNLETTTDHMITSYPGPAGLVRARLHRGSSGSPRL